MRALIIDDSMAMRRMLAAYVQGLQVTPSVAVDGQDAVEVLEREGEFEVALVDWDMPRMNGMDFVRHVKKDPRWQNMKLVMVTAHVNPDDIMEALTTGADDYLMKPVSSEMIEDKFRILGLVA
ncbi:MAG: response regulator [Candidatus Eisenbacteria bacterium]|jgi:two-component system chemotaxis response regulator CheY|nr:response regulator [Candidatus Eisenbacteria bacterium]MBP8137492.1 response regulator [Candidatus Eisenbacteria bacterium]